MKFLSRKISATFLLLVCLVISSLVMGQSVALKEYPLLNSIAEINKKSPDTCRVTAIVNSLYNCPPCPPGAICKTCIGNHIMIADSIDSKKQFRVFVGDPSKFTIGEKFILPVRLYKYDSQQEVYEGQLIE